MPQIAKTLIIGANGFLGKHFYTFYRQYFPDLIGTHHKPTTLYKQLDLSHPHIPFSIEGYSSALIAGGLVSPSKCESNPFASMRINVDGVFNLCSLLIKKGIKPIFISSGYVFDGVQGNYSETDPTNPLNTYGLHKRLIEEKLLNTFPNDCLIIRTAKVYGLTPGDNTLIDEMASLLSQGKNIFAASDQILSPISISDLIKAVTLLQMRQENGIFHIGGSSINRYQIAIHVAQALEVDPTLIREISLDSLPNNFKRAKKTNLNSTKLLNTITIQFTPLNEDIALFANYYSSLARK